MAAFNLKTHASPGGIGEAETEPPAVLNFRRPSPVGQPPAEEPVDFTRLLDEPDEPAVLPEIMLRLPDLDAVEPPPPAARFPIGSIVYWAAIVVGAAFAVWLILGNRKAAEPETEAAPAWNAPQQTQPKQSKPDPAGSHHGPHGHAPRARVVGVRETRDAANGEAGEAHILATSPPGDAAVQLAPADGQMIEPPLEAGEATENAVPANTVRMARSDEPPAGVPTSMKPSEATPLGISTTVTE